MLIIWDSTDISMPESGLTVYPGNTTTLYASYTNATSGEAISGECLANATGSFQIMDFEPSTGYFIQDITYNEPGNYIFTIHCSYLGFTNLNTTDYVDVSEMPAFNQTDSDGDGYPEFIDCNDNNANINPGKTEILYNGVDDDCNAQTFDFIVFDITTDKQDYSLSETVTVTVDATLGSETYITINTPTNISYIFILGGENYPANQEFTFTNTSGIYSIEATNYFENYTNQKTVEINVENTLHADISVNASQIFNGDYAGFTSSVSGGIPPYYYDWNFDDGYISHDPNPTHIFSQIKKHNVALKVRDSEYNYFMETIALDVVPKYILNVTVIDNVTDEPVEGVKVKIDSKYYYTDENGEARFGLTNRTYDIRISHSDYYTYSHDDFEFNSSYNMLVYLKPESEELPPLISLTEPANGTQVSGDAVTFRFYVIDNDLVNCTLYISEGDGWWTELEEFINVESNKEVKYTEEDLSGEFIMWKVECLDTAGFSSDSRQNSFRFAENQEDAFSGADAALGEEPDATFTQVQEVFDLLPDIDTYSPDQKRVVNILGVVDRLKQLKLELDKANRDLYNLKYRTDVIDVLDEREKILSEINRIKDIAPRAINVEKKVEFVKYVEDADAAKLFEKYISLKGYEYSKKEIADFIEANTLLQKKLSINTEAYNVVIEYVSGRSEELTLIHKAVDMGTISLETINFVEFIPKDLLESASEVTMLTKNVAVLEDDPIFELELTDAVELTYFVSKKIDLDKIPKISSLLIAKDAKKTTGGMASVTGFALFDRIGISPKNTTIFFIELVIILGLTVVYVAYQVKYKNDDESGAKEKRAMPAYDAKPQQSFEQGYTQAPAQKYGTPVQPDDNYTYFHKLMSTAEKNMHLHDLNKAALNYMELKFLFKRLSGFHQGQVLDKVTMLGHDITKDHLLKMIDECYIALTDGDADKVMSLYQEIETEYSLLDENMQKKIYPKCCQLLSIIRSSLSDE
ncbi:MAG: PKD domain-containing protein [Nanoarchaeota archaeon]|nr:PKD domain-containing protein [Nanoarchaeota archaeon]